MPVYRVSFDAGLAGKRAERIASAVRAQGTWCKVSESDYLVRAKTQQAAEVFGRIEPVLARRDRLLVTRVTPNLQGVLSESQWAWVKDNVR